MNRNWLVTLLAIIPLLTGALAFGVWKARASVDQPYIPPQAHGYVAAQSKLSSEPVAASEPEFHIPPQAHGYVNSASKSSFSSEAAPVDEPYIPPQAHGFIPVQPNPNSDLVTAPVAGERSSALLAGWKLAVPGVGIGLLLALGLLLRKWTMAKLAGAELPAD